MCSGVCAVPATVWWEMAEGPLVWEVGESDPLDSHSPTCRQTGNYLNCMPKRAAPALGSRTDWERLPSSSSVVGTDKGPGSAQTSRGWIEKMLEPDGGSSTSLEQTATFCLLDPVAPTVLAADRWGKWGQTDGGEEKCVFECSSIYPLNRNQVRQRIDKPPRQ